MVKSKDQKAKLLFLLDILKKQTDESHPITTQGLIEELARQGIKCERKTVYADIECLINYGFDIVSSKGYYYMASRELELAELKLLVDAVQSSKFITAKKSQQLIRKLSNMVSRYDSSQLNRQVYVSGRVKTMNESIYYNVDKLHRAMNNNHEITFKYFEWNYKKEKTLRHNGKLYRISPWSLSWDDENYYLVSYDAAEGMIRHFRVDKMIEITEQKNERSGKETFAEFDSAIYSKQTFGMFSGKPELVTLLCKKRLAGVMIDRFGNDITMISVDEDNFELTVKVTVSPPFLSWIFQFCGDVRIISPADVEQRLKAMAQNIITSYK
ncbi:MAG: WYL domain-containing protein [Clostridia bacterium]|nr:WYL domain-containing protein [Clostridia bacterium]